MPIVSGLTQSNERSYLSLSFFIVPIVLGAILILVSFTNFLLFHILAEFFAITIAILTCVVAWNMYPFTRNNYLMYLGAGYFWIGLLDLLHAMAYEGMHVIPDGGANMSVQFWIGTRYLEAILLLTAPWFLTHSLKRTKAFTFFGVVASLLLLNIMTGRFPEGFIVGKGLTAFKIYSEYIIVFILALAIVYLYKQKDYIEKRILNVIIVSIVFTMFAELAFTFYVSVYGVSNIVGHIFKIFSFWLIFQAIVKTTLQEPFLVMSRGATTYDVIPDAAIVVDENGVIHQANKQACTLANIHCSELVGKSNHEIFHPENINIESCPICQAIINNEELQALELKIDEQGHWYDFSLSGIKGASELNGTVEVIRDITQRKSAEEKVKELDILKNSIVESLPSLLFVKDANDHRYIEWNKAAEELTGLLKTEMLGKTDFDFWPKEQAQFFIDKDDETIRNGVAVDIAEEPITTKYKGTRTLHTRKIPIKDANGKAKYLLGISEDITDILETQKMLSRSQKMEVVGQMSGGIAHDFNNQLGVILGYTELLSVQALTPSQLEWIQAVKTSAERCADLTQQLLSFSRSSDIDTETVNLASIISEMKDIISKTLTPAINVEYFFSNGLWETEINKGACKDTLLNLIVNARDAMSEGDALTVEVTNFILEKKTPALVNLVPGEYIQVVLSDTGCGMSREVRDHVFEPFYTTKDVGKGTGLGLSMVYSFIKRCGGDVSLESEVGKGSTFRLYFPRLKDVGENKEKIKIINQDCLKGNEKILVVDDEPALLAFNEQLLTSWGYNVVCAENVKSALDILNDYKVDLLFSDVVMPGGENGYDLAEKALTLNPEIKILLTSGYTGKVNKSDKHDFQLLPKPYERFNLSKKLRDLLDE